LYPPIGATTTFLKKGRGRGNGVWGERQTSRLLLKLVCFFEWTSPLVEGPTKKKNEKKRRGKLKGESVDRRKVFGFGGKKVKGGTKTPRR